MKISETLLSQAGIFRCCFDIGANIRNVQRREFEHGDELFCPHCNRKFVLGPPSEKRNERPNFSYWLPVDN